MRVSNFERSGTFCHLTSLCSYLKMNILKVFPHLICIFQRGVESIQVTEYLMAADAHIVNSAEQIDQVD